HAVAHGPSRADHGIGAGIKDTASCASQYWKIRLVSCHSCSVESFAFRPRRDPRKPPLLPVFMPHAARLFAASGSRGLAVATIASAVAVGLSEAVDMCKPHNDTATFALKRQQGTWPAFCVFSPIPGTLFR